MAQVNLGHVVGPGVPTGGTANQVLVKNGATNFDTSWKDASQLPAIGDEAAAREAADAALADGLAIIANGDTHAAVAAGQAVFVRSHSTLAEGLYWASSAIGTNAALSTSNLTADNKGGLNKLKGDIDSLNSKISYFTLIQTQTLTNNYETYNFITGRVLSDYEVIIISPDMGGWYNNSCIIPKTAFINTIGVNTFYHDGANVIEVDVKYVSNTSISAKYIGSPSGNVHLNMYGILKK